MEIIKDDMEVWKEIKVVNDNEHHKKNVQVGKDIIEDVEYFSYLRIPFEYTKTFKDKLEDFWDNITLPFWKIKHNVVRVYWQTRYGFQRMFKGYDSVDVFDTFSKFANRYRKILTEYKKTHYGYPGTMTNEEWENIVDEMLYHLHYMEEDNVVEELEKDVPEEWSVSLTDVNKIMEKHKDEFFKLFSEYFYNLWD